MAIGQMTFKVGQSFLLCTLVSDKEFKVIIRTTVCCNLFWFKMLSAIVRHPFNNECVINYILQASRHAFHKLLYSLFRNCAPFSKKCRLEGDEDPFVPAWHSAIEITPKMFNWVQIW